MNLSLGLGLSSLRGLFGGAWEAYKDRVIADGGTVYDTARSRVVYRAVTTVFEPTLLCSCDAGKAAVLYSLIVFDDIDTFITRVTSAVIEDSDFLIETTHDLLRAEVYEKASLVNVCVAGDAGNLYSLKA